MISLVENDIYSQLAAPVVDDLKAAAARIMSHFYEMERHYIAIGRELLRAKELYPGQFMAWAAQEFDMSHDTLNNYMKAARASKAIPELENPSLEARTLYLLSQPGIDKEGLLMARSIINETGHLEYKIAFILCKSPVYLRDAYRGGDVSQNDAYESARRLNAKSTPEELIEDCRRHHVTNPQVIDYLLTKLKDRHKTAHDLIPSTTYNDIMQDDGMLNGYGWSVHLSQANEQLVERYKADRAAMHKSLAGEAFDWHRFNLTVERDKAGRLVIALPDKLNDMVTDNERVVINVRVKRQPVD